VLLAKAPDKAKGKRTLTDKEVALSKVKKMSKAERAAMQAALAQHENDCEEADEDED